MDKSVLITVLEEIALLLELKGENPFKTRAYQNGARIMQSTDLDLEKLSREKKLESLKGIGAGLAEKITEFINSGTIRYHEELKLSTPPGLLEMLLIPSLGPRKVKQLYETLKIQSTGELEYACKENRLIDLPGFGKKTQDKILTGLGYLKKSKNLHRIDSAHADAQSLLQFLIQNTPVKRISLGGSIRRMKEVVKDIDIVASSPKPDHVMKTFISLPGVEEIIAHGPTKSSIRLASGINADLRIVSDTEFPYALHHFTGSKEHNIALRGRAQKMGMKMNEYGLFKKETLLPCKDEKDIFRRLDLTYIPPELRENTGEIEAAENDRLPSLIELKDIAGIFHVHTTMSDGETSLEKMASAARRKGYTYIGISDHSKTAFYAHGLKEPDCKKQNQLIDSLNKRSSDFYIFKGIESDILPDGSLDYPDAILKSFDFVIGSIHSQFNLNESDMTRRIVKAIKSTYCTILGHPTGRLLLAREGYAINHRDIIQACSDYGVCIELNANPYRLDIDWRYIRLAQEKKVLISINPDAHSIEDIDYVPFGVGIARKGWLEKKDVLNTRSLVEIKQFLNSRR